MSKKKNTLKDLDEFLKQQAATLVSPQRLSDKVEAPPSSPPQEQTQETSLTTADTEKEAISSSEILSDLRHLATREGAHFKEHFYDLIIQTMEFQNHYSPEDKMLINTALYLKNGERWKEAIREYWRKKS
jgi:hypothetical protein